MEAAPGPEVQRGRAAPRAAGGGGRRGAAPGAGSETEPGRGRRRRWLSARAAHPAPAQAPATARCSSSSSSPRPPPPRRGIPPVRASQPSPPPPHLCARPRGPDPAPARPLGAPGLPHPQPPGVQEPQARSAQPRDRVPSGPAWPGASQAALRRDLAISQRVGRRPRPSCPSLPGQPHPILARRGLYWTGRLPSLPPATGLISPVRAGNRRAVFPGGTPNRCPSGPLNFPLTSPRIPRSLAGLASARASAPGQSQAPGKSLTLGGGVTQANPTGASGDTQHAHKFIL